MTTEINEDDIQRAVKEEQAVADEAHIEHVKQRVAVLRAALNNLTEEHNSLKAAYQELQASQAAPEPPPAAAPAQQPDGPMQPGPDAAHAVVPGEVVA